VTLLEGFHYLYHPVTRRLHELLATGELGQLRRVEVDLVIPAPADDDPRWSLELAGGALMDLGCYALHAHRMLAPWAGGPPRVVAARGRERAGHPGVDEWLKADPPHLHPPAGGAQGPPPRRRPTAHRRRRRPGHCGADRIDACYRAAGFQPRPRTPRMQPPGPEVRW
jgi:hypothetical protein